MSIISEWFRAWLLSLVKMQMPLDLYEVRHGESEGNVMGRMAWEDIPEALRRAPSFFYRLTDAGVARAKLVGTFIREELPPIDVLFYSPYTRAMETAYYLDIPTEYRMRLELREREYGAWDRPADTSEEETVRQACLEGRRDLPMYWRAHSGESIVEVMERCRSMYGTLHREHSGQSVLMVLHGETMMASAALMHRWTAEDLKVRVDARDPLVKVDNCQVNHWSRVHPETGKVHPHMEWVRVLRPWDPAFDQGWRRIERMNRSRDQLLEIVEQHPRYLA
jgi:broad specificity phosphatase PhoE